jgi:flagellar motor component MotA
MLEVFLKEENFKKITIFQLELTKLFYEAKNMSQQELEKQLERKKKPFTQKEIEMIVEEGRKMGEEYGKKIKRIGNGCG